MEIGMRQTRKQQMRLQDVIRIVSQYSRNDQEAALAVADMINRGVVRIRGHWRDHKVVVA
jgi:hypothetical protein